MAGIVITLASLLMMRRQLASSKIAGSVEPPLPSFLNGGFGSRIYFAHRGAGRNKLLRFTFEAGVFTILIGLACAALSSR